MNGGKAKNLTWLKEIVPDFVQDFFVVNFDVIDLAGKFEEASILFNENELLAFRSSANLEDGEKNSFAGIFDSYLNIPFNKENFVKYIELVRSKINSERVKSYLIEKGIKKNVEMNVILQRMFVPEYAGVAFWYGDSKGENLLTFGKGKSVIDGEDAIEISNPSSNTKGLPEFYKWGELFETFNLIREKYEIDCDIEWGINKKQFTIFQVRPITVDYRNTSDSIVFDSTNIGENYPGVTAPLTYSFIRKAYEEVYFGFVKILGVNVEILESKRIIFANMLGYIQGKVYYNISNWYKMFELLPFYETNKVFFENMLNPAKRDVPKGKFKFTLSSILPTIRILYYMLFPSVIYKTFDKKFELALKSYDEKDLKRLSSFEVLNQYEIIQKKFFSLWSYTILNDFRVMIFYGILTVFSKKYLKNGEEFLTHLTDDIETPHSVDVLNLLVEMGKMIYKNSELKEAFKLPSAEVLKEIENYEDFNNLFTSYLAKYGNRSSNELKIEEPKFNERPELLIDLLRQYIDQSQVTEKRKNNKVKLIPQGNFFVRILAQYLKKETLKSIYKREKYRVKRGEVFGLTRYFFLNVGEKFVAEGILKERTDIFYLYYNEISDLVRFHSLPQQDFISIIELRKNQVEQYKKQEIPIRVIAEGFNFGEINLIDDTYLSSHSLIGSITSNYGNVSGVAVVMTEFDPSIDVKGKILVTKKTDPGWTVIFPLVKGLVVERGNNLSHASIISRELGRTCIVNVKNATSLIKTGDSILINTLTGEVVKIDE